MNMLNIFKKNKKGVEMSMNVIVVAAIALVVLIVLIIVFASRLGLFNEGVNSCDDKGGKEAGSNVECIRKGGTPIGPLYKPNGERDGNKICCIVDK